MDPVRGISIIVCTYNRAPRLRLTLAHLFECESPPSSDSEIVVVDNNSGDETKQVFDECAAKSPVRISYVFECRPGLGHARNAGIRQARGDIISLVDDDAIPDSRFIVAVKAAFDAQNRAGIIGGRVELWDSADLPLTIKQDRTRQVLTPEAHPSGFMLGCNMSIHRQVIETIGGFDRRLDAGTPTRSGGDLDFYYRAIRSGFLVTYCPDIVVYHNHGRRTPQAEKALTAGYQIGRGAFYAKHILAGDRRIQRYAYWEYYNGVRAIVVAPFNLRRMKSEWSVLSNYGRGAVRFIRARRSAGPYPEKMDA